MFIDPTLIILSQSRSLLQDDSSLYTKSFPPYSLTAQVRTNTMHIYTNSELLHYVHSIVKLSFSLTRLLLIQSSTPTR